MLGEVVADLCARAEFTEVDVAGLVGAVSGYVVDAPSDARSALEPLMAAFDFDAAERAGQIVFFHRDADTLGDIELGQLAAASAADAFAQRGDAAEAPIEARIRFIDPARDYLLASVSARRMDRAEGGVISLDAPLVIEADSAETIAQNVLSDQRAATETLRIGLGPAHLMLEPGDRVTFADSVFSITRIEDAELRALELTRARTPGASHLNGGEPGAPIQPALAPTPVFAVLDLPPLPNAEDDERPLAAVFASPWLGPHDLFAGPEAPLRARVNDAAAIGELLWALWPGPVDRWDEGNVILVKLYGGALASTNAESVLNGANVFAIESANGEYEIVQARNCTLVAPNEYELSGFLRGQLGSAHARQSPHPVGARFIVLDDRLARFAVSPHEWGEALSVVAPPAGGLATDPRAGEAVLTLPHAALRPWAPAHLTAKRISGGAVSISWVRCARRGGDGWSAGEPPLGAAAESYKLDILDGSTVKRSVTALTPSYLYSSADQTADFGTPPASLRLRVAQIGDSGLPGLNNELTIAL
jgi:hypothetical protein